MTWWEQNQPHKYVLAGKVEFHGSNSASVRRLIRRYGSGMVTAMMRGIKGERA